ncbi:MAG: ATP-binding protein [Polyangiaceae bacterium]
MKPPDTPATEAERLAALGRYAVVDTPPESAFDQLTAIVAQLLDMPIALVSLVTADRQWFKSSHGLAAKETSRVVSFCGHVVADDATLVVENALDDERFVDNPLVTEDPNIRFYAGAPLRTPDGHVLGTLCVIDRTPRALTPQQLELLEALAEQTMAQLELRRHARVLADREARLRAVIDGMAEGVMTLDAAGRVMACNEVATQVIGASCGALLEELRAGRVTMVDEAGEPLALERWPAQVARSTGELQSGIVVGIQSRDRDLTWLSVNARPVPAESGGHEVIVTFRDVTAQRKQADARDRLRRQMAQQQRLVTTGTLAAGLGHELNNPLSYVAANLQVAVEQLDRVTVGPSTEVLGELRAALSDASQGVQRIASRLSALRAFSGDRIEARPMAPSQALELAVEMCEHDVRRRATLDVEDFSAVPLVLANVVTLSQAMVHVVMNATEAFDSNDPESNRIRISSVTTDRSVQIEIADDGPGIDDAVVERMYEPYFTTKPVGRSLGLGLTIVKSTIEALRGSVECRTRPGEGTTFTITLPRAQSGAPSTTEPQPVADGARVLVIDDEEAILRTFRRILRRHEVVTVSDPREALARIRRGETFDVIFCDLMMPHLTGMEVHGSVHAIDSELARRFVFITGGVLDSETKSFLDDLTNLQVAKPFDIAEVRRIVSVAIGVDEPDRS